MGNAPKITKITLDKVQYDIDLPSDASPVIDSLEVTRKLTVLFLPQVLVLELLIIEFV